MFCLAVPLAVRSLFLAVRSLLFPLFPLLLFNNSKAHCRPLISHRKNAESWRFSANRSNFPLF